MVAVLLASQAYCVALWRGEFQPFLPALGYSLAIFSIWALLTPIVLKIADRLYAARLNRPTTAALWVLGWPATTAIHLTLFVALFWPVYGTKFATPFEMAQPVLMANMDKSAIAYLALIVVAYFRRRIRERANVQDCTNGSYTENEGLWIRMAGGKQLVRFQEIDWIAAAGDYAEVHAGDQNHLTDNSLASLVEQLPQNEFARIHRGAIVRIDRVREVRGLGRGDAYLYLRGGQTLRLSRRYREDLAIHLPL